MSACGVALGGFVALYNLTLHEICGGNLMTLAATIGFLVSGVSITIGVPVTGKIDRNNFRSLVLLIYHTAAHLMSGLYKL